MHFRKSIPAKIIKPRMDVTLNREHLFRILDDYRKSPVVWVVGPAGSGEISLICSYIEQRKLVNIWYKIDENDADPASTFYYLTIALKINSPRKNYHLPLFTPEYALGLPVFTKRFFETLFGKLAEPAVIILDNYQKSATEPLTEIINNAIAVIPKEISIFILSRTKPPAVLARAIVNQKMKVLGWNDLQLRLEESRPIIEKIYQKDLSETIIHKLHERLDGWIAGLILMLSQKDIEKYQPQSLSHNTPEIVFDHFGSELFNKAPQEIQSFLIATSLLSQITPDMAQSLTRNVESKKILEKLHSDNLFAFKHRGNPPFYIFHALFRDFLI